MARTIWLSAADRRDEARQAAAATSVHPVLAHVLLNRGVPADQFGAFLRPTRACVPDSALLADFDVAVERLARAIRDGEKIAVWGDFDADGLTAAAILTRLLRRFGAAFAYYVPDRFSEGYGVHAKSLLTLITSEKPKLLVTVDCGISAAQELNTAVALGCDVIVTDHHQVPERRPDAPAVNPQRDDSAYPFRTLCGAAVAAKVACAVAAALGQSAETFEAEVRDLIAIGTVADVMPLVGENRYYVLAGLRELGNTPSIGLRALLETARLGRDGRYSAGDIGFGIGPRLNAAGRLEHAKLAYRLLTTDDRAEAYELAETLDRLNRERQEIEGRTVEEAAEQLSAVSVHETWGLVVSGAGWHEGVLGLVAGRICQQHRRPTLAIRADGESARGSGRGIDPLDLHDALTDCGELLTQFGGHRKAAGFTLPAANIGALREQFDAAVKKRLTADDLVPRLTIECPIRGTAAKLELALALEQLAPFGEGHAEPLFEIRGLTLTSGKATRDGQHLQLSLADEKGRALKGFWPREGRLASRLPLGAPVKMAAYLRVDSYNGRSEVQLVAEDLKRDSGA